MTVTLRAAVPFPIPPDSNEPERSARTFQTNITTTEGGQESRAALRDVPVRRYEYAARFGSQAEALRFRTLWQATPDTERLRFVVPLWQRQAVPTAIAGTTLSGDFRWRPFTTGPATAFLWLSETQFELVGIDTIADGSIELLAPVVGTYAIGPTLLLPAMNAWMDPPVIGIHSSLIESVPLTFREELRGIAGIDRTVGLDLVPVVGSVQVVTRATGSEWAGHKFRTYEANVYDEAGFVVPDTPILWTVTLVTVEPDNTKISEHYDGRLLHIAYDGGTDTYFHVTATAGGVVSPAVA